MFETLKRLWDDGKLTEQKLRIAITKYGLTPEQFKEISGVDY